MLTIWRKAQLIEFNIDKNNKLMYYIDDKLNGGEILMDIIAIIKKAYSDIWNFIAGILDKFGVELDTSNIPEWVMPK